MRTPPGDAAPLLVESTRWNPPARFGVYEIGDPAIEDETLIDLWVDEGLPHPRVPGPWDRPAARTWLTAWINATSDISDFAMVPRTSTPHYAPTHPSCKAPPHTHTHHTHHTHHHHHAHLRSSRVSHCSCWHPILTRPLRCELTFVLHTYLLSNTAREPERMA